MRQVVSAIFIFFGFMCSAYSDEYKCDAGYYLDDDGETCIKCVNGAGSAYSYYCPGDDTRHPCPTIPDDENKQYFVYYARWATGSLNTSMSNCRAHYKNIPILHGKLHMSCPYSTTTNSYYSSDCQAENYGHTVCDAGYYVWRSTANYSNIGNFAGAIAYEHCKPVGHGYWSPDSNARRTMCATGTHTATTTSASANECAPCTNLPANGEYTGPNTDDETPVCPFQCNSGYGRTESNQCNKLCQSGISELHIDAHIFNVYANKNTGHALHVKYNDDICYISLGDGNRNNALNIKVDDRIYHTIN